MDEPFEPLIPARDSRPARIALAATIVAIAATGVGLALVRRAIDPPADVATVVPDTTRPAPVTTAPIPDDTVEPEAPPDTPVTEPGPPTSLVVTVPVAGPTPARHRGAPTGPPGPPAPGPVPVPGEADAAVAADGAPVEPPPSLPTSTVTTRPAPTTTRAFPTEDGYTGEIWLSLATDEPGPHVVEVRWGPWGRRFAVTGGQPVVYHFTKNDATSPAFTLFADFAVSVDTGPGTPSGSIEANSGWYSVS